jgi:hypothetical protein
MSALIVDRFARSGWDAFGQRDASEKASLYAALVIHDRRARRNVKRLSTPV